MTVQQLAFRLDERIPETLSEPWDHDGQMLVPSPEAEVTGVLCALDCTSSAISAAKARGCNVIVTHHPLLFRPLERLTPTDSVGKRVLSCVQAGIAVLSYHTRLDCLPGGVNDCLSAALGLQDCRPFVPYGRIGTVEETTFEAFLQRAEIALQERATACVKATETVRRVAVVSGCGKDEIAAVLAAGADTFVTGEVMHNHLIDCHELGLNLLCLTHHATERVVIPVLAGLVRETGLLNERPVVEFAFVKEDEYGI